MYLSKSIKISCITCICESSITHSAFLVDSFFHDEELTDCQAGEVFEASFTFYPALLFSLSLNSASTSLVIFAVHVSDKVFNLNLVYSSACSNFDWPLSLWKEC